MTQRIKKIQTAIFTRNFNISGDLEKAEIFTRLNEHAGSIFDGAPMQFPIPNEAPPEFPRFTLKNQDGKFNCNISLLRSDVFYKIETERTENNLDTFLEKQKLNSLNIFNFLKSRNVIINRVGFIVEIEEVLEGEERASDYLKNKFIKDREFEDPKELVLRYNQSGNTGNFEMNNLTLFSGKNSNNVLIQFDINTIAENMESMDLDESSFNEIIDYSIGKINELLNNFSNI